MQGKKVSESFTVMNEMVLPNDTNGFGTLMGGRLVYWMDIAASIAACKHSNLPCMTASIDNLSFKNSIKLSNIVHVEAQVTRAFNTSIEVYLKVWGEDMLTKHQYESNEAFFTFVALDANRRPKAVPPVIPVTEQEISLFDGAMHRRQIRLILSGRLNPDEATEDLKNFFVRK